MAEERSNNNNPPVEEDTGEGLGFDPEEPREETEEPLPTFAFPPGYEDIQDVRVGDS